MRWKSILAPSSDVKAIMNDEVNAHLTTGTSSVLRRCSHHVAQPHGSVAGVVLHQRVVMRGEEGAAADLLGQLLHYGAGDGRAVVSGRSPACGRVHSGTVTADRNQVRRKRRSSLSTGGGGSERRSQTYPTHPGAPGSAWWRGAGCSPSRSAPRRKCSPLEHRRGG